jgi:hypothetical protein
MDLGLGQGIYSSNTNGANNGVNNGIINGNANGIYNELSQYGMVRDGLVLNVDAGIRSSYIGSGLTWNDLTPNAINGTLLASTMRYSSLNRGSIIFNGINDNYITTPVNNLLNFINAPFSSNVWCKINSFSTTFELFNKGDTGDGALESYRAAVNITTGKYLITLYDTSGANQSTATTVASVPLNRWVNLCHTYSGSGGNAGLVLYINGVPQETTLSSVGAFIQMRSQATNLWLGSFGTTGAFRSVRSNGEYAMFQIYNTQLTQAQVLQNYNSQKKRFNL